MVLSDYNTYICCDIVTLTATLSDMEDITEYFIEILNQTHSIDIAESEFKRTIADDDELHALYRRWCQEVGSSEKNGFIDFCEEYVDDRNEVWDTLNDYDE